MNWRIRGFISWCHEQVICFSLFWNLNRHSKQDWQVFQPYRKERQILQIYDNLMTGSDSKFLFSNILHCTGVLSMVWPQPGHCTAWRMPWECMKTVWRLSDATWQLPMKTTWQLPINYYLKSNYLAYHKGWNVTYSWHQKNETTNSPIQSTDKRPASLLKPLYNGVLFLIHYFKKHLKPCFFILKALKNILQHFKFVNWWIRGFVFLMPRTG